MIDEKWHAAILALINPPDGVNPDPVPFVALLRTDESMPKVVRLMLASALDPKDLLRPNWSLYLRWTGAYDKFGKMWLRDRGIFFEIEAASKTRGGMSAAIEKIAAKYKLERNPINLCHSRRR